jgi:PAS domain-containing protein
LHKKSKRIPPPEERSLELSSQELLQINAEMRAVFQALPDQYFRVDRDGHILDYKTSLLQAGNAADAKRIGGKMEDFFPVDTWRILGKNIENVIRLQTILTIDFHLKLHNTDFFYEARLVPIFKEQVIIILRDITIRQEAAQENKKLYKQFLHAPKMEAVGIRDLQKHIPLIYNQGYLTCHCPGNMVYK